MCLIIYLMNDQTNNTKDESEKLRKKEDRLNELSLLRIKIFKVIFLLSNFIIIFVVTFKF